MNNLMTKILTWSAAALVTAGGFAAIAHAQGPGRSQGFGPGGFGPGGFGPGGGFIGGMIGHALDLTDAQREQIKAIVKDAFDSNQALATQMKAAHEAERAAIKAGKSDPELAQLAQSYSSLHTQFHTVRLQTEAKIYKVLTPAQQAKLDEMRTKMREHFGNRFHRPGPPAQQQ